MVVVSFAGNEQREKGDKYASKAPKVILALHQPPEAETQSESLTSS